jgi:DNA-binding response OmpR family regulator
LPSRAWQGPSSPPRSSLRSDLASRPKEYALLLALASQPDRVFAKPELMQAVWGYDGDDKTRTLDSHASRLRRKLGAAGAGEMVINTWGIGYRL